MPQQVGSTRDVEIAPSDHEPSADEMLGKAADAVRQIERFAYRMVSVANTPDEVFKARTVLQIVTGLRRKLEQWRSNG